MTVIVVAHREASAIILLINQPRQIFSKQNIYPQTNSTRTFRFLLLPNFKKDETVQTALRCNQLKEVIKKWSSRAVTAPRTN